MGVTTEQARHCRSCGAAFAGPASFCTSCGAPRPRTSASAAPFGEQPTEPLDGRAASQATGTAPAARAGSTPGAPPAPWPPPGTPAAQPGPAPHDGPRAPSPSAGARAAQPDPAHKPPSDPGPDPRRPPHGQQPLPSYEAMGSYPAAQSGQYGPPGPPPGYPGVPGYGYEGPQHPVQQPARREGHSAALLIGATFVGVLAVLGIIVAIYVAVSDSSSTHTRLVSAPVVTSDTAGSGGATTTPQTKHSGHGQRAPETSTPQARPEPHGRPGSRRLRHHPASLLADHKTRVFGGVRATRAKPQNR